MRPDSRGSSIFPFAFSEKYEYEVSLVERRNILFHDLSAELTFCKQTDGKLFLYASATATSCEYSTEI